MVSTTGLVTLLASMVACEGDGNGFYPATGTGGTSTTTTTTTSTSTTATSTTTGTTTSSTGTTTSTTTTTGGSGEQDSPGDILMFPTGEEAVILTDGSGESNRDQEFYLVMINEGVGPEGYRLNYTPGSPPSSPPARASAGTVPKPPAPLRPGRHPVAAAPPPLLQPSDIGSAPDEFYVRSAFNNDDEFRTVNATLWGLGEHVAIWVDDDVPIDWDQDCDGVVDVPAERDAYGFDNCDLQDVADIVDTNLVVNLVDAFGGYSDVNGDGKVSVVVTPVLNALPTTSGDDADHASIISSYADPDVDLSAWDFSTNPGSDEQEVIYVFAPDPNGFYNPNAKATVDAYTSQELAAEIARSLVRLISYNQKVLSRGGSAEEEWLVEGLAAVGADLTGFGAVVFDDAWRYLDASHLYPLTSLGDSADGFFSTTPVGSQYLFVRWLVDVYGPGLLKQLTQTNDVGVAAIEAATGETIANLVTSWQVALLTTGATDSTGNPLVDPAVWPSYQPPVTLSAPTTPPKSPVPGVYYGANGHQSGFTPRGTNRFVEAGTTSAPIENISRRVTTEGPDAHLYTPGFSFSGWTDANYAAAVVRLTDIPYEFTTIEIQQVTSSLFGFAIRWNDPGSPDFVVENVFSPLESDAVAMLPLPESGAVIRGVGELTVPVNTSVVGDEGLAETQEVQDTDRWVLDLTGYPASQSVPLAVWVERRFVDAGGTIGTEDIWLAVAPEGDVPTPVVGITASDATCLDGPTWAYPSLLIGSVFEQYFLKTSAYSDSDSEFDACGVAAEETPSCADDWDGDGVAEADEPSPQTFVQQVRVQQCSNYGEASYSGAWVDVDETDDDNVPSIDTVYNVGGVNWSEGEEAVLQLILEGGQRYLVVLGANSNIGPYELRARWL